MLKMQLSSIPEGNSHQEYEWIMKDSEAFEKNGEISIHAIFEVNNIHCRQYEVKGVLAYNIHFDCDRCTSPFQMEFAEPVRFILKKDYLGDDMDIISFNDNQVDLTDYLRDIIIVSIPIKKLCREDCKGLCPHCGVNLNKGKCNCTK